MFTLCPPPSTELLPKGSKEEQRDYVFYLAVGNYRLKVRRSSLLPPPPALGGPRRPLVLLQGRALAVREAEEGRRWRGGGVLGTEVQGESRLREGERERIQLPRVWGAR